MTQKIYKNPIKNRDKNYNKIPSELLNMRNLSCYAFRIYSYICSWDECFSGYKKIQECTGLSKGTISKALKELVGANMISYDRGTITGKRKSNAYTIVDPKDWNMDSPQHGPVHNVDKSRTRTGKFVKKLSTVHSMDSYSPQYGPETVHSMDSTNKEITYTNEKEEIKEALDKLSVIKREEQEKLKKTLYVKYDYDFLTQVEKEITGKSSFFPSW